MARFAYYADQPDGSILEWKDTSEPTGGTDLFGNPTRRTVAARVQHDGRRTLGFHAGQWVPITRTVRLKSSPSRHVCDVRCINAKGRAMECECACGGKNHGRGAFMRCTPA
jgi:hypothetical protein